MKLLSIVTGILLSVSILFSQNEFMLGFTGTYPDGIYYSTTQATNWSWYPELSMNFWQGFYLGDNHPEVLNKLADPNYNLYGMFDIDTIKWAAFGRYDIIEAEATTGHFRYNYHRCGTPVADWQFGGGNTVMYYDKNSQCNEQSPQGLVLSQLYENAVYSFGSWNPFYEVWFDRDPVENTWFVKPRVRIDSTETEGAAKNVFRIIVRDYNGNIVDSVTITTDNFKDNNGNYDGRYLEEYNLIDFWIEAGDTLGDLNYGHPGYHFTTQYLEECDVDFQIYWYGQVSMWVDNVKIMNRPANLFFGNTQESKDIRGAIYRKANTLYTHYGNDKMIGFYTEETEYVDLLCMKAVNDSLAHWFSGSDKVMIHALIDWDSYHLNLKSFDRDADYGAYIDMIRPTAFMACYYTFIPYGYNLPYYQEYYDQKLPENVSFVDQQHYPRLVAAFEESRINGDKVSYSQYNSYIQHVWDDYADTMYYFNGLSREGGVKFYAVPPVCNWKTGDDYGERLREPMNSEFGALCGISLCRGATGIMPFIYHAGYHPKEPDWNVYFYGMTDFDSVGGWWGYLKRDHNFYGEEKWNYVKKLYGNIKTWGPIIANSPNTAGYSVARDGANYQFISDIASINPAVYGPCYCADNLVCYDCTNERYWEMGFFNPSRSIGGDYTKYVMLANRRCIPASTSPSYAGDNRVLRIKFNGNNLPSSFSNWKISAVGDSESPSVYFHREYNSYIDLGSASTSIGWFEPGEVKLLKIEPVIKAGGTLVADEVIDADSLTCLDNVFTNGFNLTINNNSEIHFTDTSTFVIEGGSFTMGDAEYSGPANITCDAASGNNWSGFTFIDCDVRIYNSIFNARVNDTIYALNMIDCPLIDIRNSTFSNSQDNYAGGINVTYYDIDSIENVYIKNNSFGYSSVVPSVSVMSYAGITTPLIMEDNTFTSGSNNSTAIMLSGITGGAVKTNSISGYRTGINLLSSYIDVYDNTIYSELGGSMGIFAASGSEIKMSPAGYMWLGGLNDISNTGSGSKNISVEGSYFLMDQGENIFNINDGEDYHLSGYFPLSTPIYFTTDATENCFKLESAPVNPPYQYVTWDEQGQQVQFTFTPYLSGCEAGGGEGLMAINLGNGIYDSIATEGVGGGGSERISNVKYEILDLKAESEAKSKAKPNSASTQSMHSKILTLTPKQLNDSINILMRYRNYTQAKNKCYEMINTYPDSIQSINSISKLFLAVTSTDTTQNVINQLKTYYESLILNHSNNTALVQHCNYFVQKCKVRLHQYSSALAGFQQIINNNPYSYEGLVARWDYMATSLLMNGYGGSERETSNNLPRLLGVKRETNELSDESEEFDESEELGDDKSPFSKEERITIKQNVRTAFEKTKNYHEKKIELLERELQNKDERNNEKAKHELQRMNTLRQVIKVEKPKDIIEHIKIVSSDIQKLFGGAPSTDSKQHMSMIPSVYRLAQNYPNPFNPVTTIQYELPKDSKVKLVVYDLLGREVKTLVNEIKSAGYYRIEFNMQNYASGVYFFRIEADPSASSGLNGDKFVDAKKMVLVK